MKKFIKDKSNFSLLFFYFSLSLISVISIFLAEYNNNKTPTLFIKQILFYIISIFVIYTMQRISIHTYEKFSIVFFIFTISLLALVLIAPESIAPTVNGAKGWFNFKFFTIQPSEFAKVSSVGIVSFLIVQDHFKKSSDIVKLIELAIILIIPFILIMKENDLGNGLYFIFLFLSLVFLVSSRNKTFFVIYSSVMGLGAFLLLCAIYFPSFLNIIGLKNYQLNRILSWLSPEKFTYDYSYQITQALNAIKSGGLTGSFAKNTVYIDEQFNDFILSVIAKNFGFIGSVLFITLYFLFIIKIMRIAKQCQQGNFSYYFTILTAFNFALPFIINTYSSTGLIPVIGISLPFISYGGSSLLANSILLGIIFKINKTINEEQLADEQDYNDYTDYIDEYSN
ncbi:FtsW/RodA/SpoVE family cell cycle protein [Gemella sp. GH3]|uniref:FtsW/RodA/SpoVE family cell cycle protein n=1 Tax=unclassified Gemella TaxID=2624949 RepID=UPI0015D0BE11|nr:MULTISPECIES: FtsW/RodA/SpoVE family cell cycle protein [unclassified Gemella]MBF0714336.1 FtsW/RodA/SpoVE family cell cycle protein [Gemella sp. GH3.1]NYS51288.1 FtsW/RodA/SpoVE family cell cycle protein [Gemella sp. GH3]